LKKFVVVLFLLSLLVLSLGAVSAQDTGLLTLPKEGDAPFGVVTHGETLWLPAKKQLVSVTIYGDSTQETKVVIKANGVKIGKTIVPPGESLATIVIPRGAAYRNVRVVANNGIERVVEKAVLTPLRDGCTYATGSIWAQAHPTREGGSQVASVAYGSCSHVTVEITDAAGNKIATDRIITAGSGHSVNLAMPQYSTNLTVKFIALDGTVLATHPLTLNQYDNEWVGTFALYSISQYEGRIYVWGRTAHTGDYLLAITNAETGANQVIHMGSGAGEFSVDFAGAAGTIYELYVGYGDGLESSLQFVVQPPACVRDGC
jgi:hypothetical protein